MSQKNFFIFATGIISGIFFFSFYNWGWPEGFFFVFLGLIFLFLKLKFREYYFLLIALFLLGTGLGCLRYYISTFREPVLEEINNKKFFLSGIIYDDPEERENYQRFVLETKIKETKQKILVYTEKYPLYKYGDKINLWGEIKSPQNYSYFDWRDYLSKDDIYYEIFYPRIEFISSHNGSLIKEKLFSLREKFLISINKNLIEPNASFLAGITIGAKSIISKDLKEKFQKTGVIHIVVLSGYNITIVAKSIILFFSFLPSVFNTLLGVLSIIFFTIMTGGAATTIRASIMAVLVIGARFFGRLYNVSWSLFLAGLFMLLHNPKILRFDASFQLSFLATIAMIYLAPILNKKFSFLPQKFNFRETVSSTLAAQIMVLPLLVYKTGLISLYALPANILILPLIPLTMFLGFLVGGLGMININLAAPFSWLSYVLTQYELYVINFFANLPFASFIISNLPVILVIIIYIIIALFILKNKEGRKEKNIYGEN